MANNKIQIRRSATNVTIPSLSNGELAFTGNGDILYIGHPDGTTGNIRIGGKQIPGTLTANQALVANSTSGIDKLITANLTLSSFSVSTINAVANLTHLGAATNSELTTTWAIKTFVDAKIAQASNPQGSNGQLQYNNSGVLAGTSNFVYDNTNGRITVGNSTVNVQLGYTGDANALAHFHGNQNAYVQVILNNVNGGISASSDYVLENDLGTETTNFLDLGINSSNYNDANYSAMGAGDSYLYAANNDLVIGTKDSGGGELRFVTGGVTTSQVRATVTVGGNVGIGNTTPNARLQVTGTANISGLTTVTANLVLGSGLTANGGGGSAGQLLTSGGTGNVYWAPAPTTVAGSNSQIQFNANGVLAGDSGLTFDGVTDTLSVAGAVNVGANVVVNTTMVFIGNSTVNSDLTSSILQIANSTSTANLTALDLKIGATTTVNSTQVTATLLVGNVSGSYANITGQVNTATLYAATSANIASAVQANSIGIFTTGTANAQNFTAGAGFGAASVGATVNSGTIGISTNTTVNTSITSAIVQVSNSTATSNLTAIGLSAGANVVANTTALRVGNTTITTTNAVFGGTIAANGGVGTAGQVLISGGSTNSYWSNSLGTFQFTDVTVSGNLTVLGDLVSLNVATLSIEDSLITLAKDQAATTTYTDVVDIGFIAPYGNTATANSNWTGLFRDQSDSGIYKLFSGNIPTPTTTVDTTNVNFAFATLQAQLRAGGTGATAFIANSSHVNITANSTTNVFITANTLSLTTALPVTSGGIGLNSVAVGDLLVGNSTNTLTRLASGADGYVLQINGTGVVAWNTLDGGTF